MRIPVTRLGLLVLILFSLSECERNNMDCFDHPESFAAGLENDARQSLKPSATVADVRQFCTNRHLLIEQRDSEVYCTAEAHRALSRCAVVLEFQLGSNGIVKMVKADKAEIKNP